MFLRFSYRSDSGNILLLFNSLKLFTILQWKFSDEPIYLAAIPSLQVSFFKLLTTVLYIHLYNYKTCVCYSFIKLIIFGYQPKSKLKRSQTFWDAVLMDGTLLIAGKRTSFGGHPLHTVSPFKLIRRSSCARVCLKLKWRSRIYPRKINKRMK